VSYSRVLIYVVCINRKTTIVLPTPLNNRSVLLTQYCAGDKIEKNEMGVACGTYGGRDRGAQGVGGETIGKETTGETKA
jgi:hypothetical protein